MSLEDRDYHPVDPSRIKPLGDIEPTRRILEALDEFFRPERPRDGEGWEEDGLSGFFDKKRRARRRRSRSRSPPPSRRRRSRSPERKRSLSPPRWSLGSDSSREKKRKATDKVAFVAKSADSPLDRGNLGFKMLKGMGWEGEGLGKAGAGIQEPVKAAESRDRSERFVGLGNVRTPSPPHQPTFTMALATLHSSGSHPLLCPFLPVAPAPPRNVYSLTFVL